MILDFSGGSKYSIEEFIKLNNKDYNIDSAQLENFRNPENSNQIPTRKIIDSSNFVLLKIFNDFKK